MALLRLRVLYLLCLRAPTHLCHPSDCQAQAGSEGAQGHTPPGDRGGALSPSQAGRRRSTAEPRTPTPHPRLYSVRQGAVLGVGVGSEERRTFVPELACLCVFEDGVHASVCPLAVVFLGWNV